MTRRALVISLLLLSIAQSMVAVQGASQAPAKKPKIEWSHDVDESKKKAEKLKMPLMIDFYTDWCGWCKRLDKDTYTDPEVIKLSKKFVCVKVDADTYKDYARQCGVTGYPTILFVNSKWEIIGQVGGYKNAKDFAKEMEAALKKAK